jgi:hypothetical protein
MVKKMVEKKEKRINSNILGNLSLLNKIRIMVGSILILSSLSIALSISDNFPIGVALALLGYFILIILMIKLLTLKTL